ncbi:hypothetical protein BT93_H2360 [Corymbia citriodora subsp. variegata]|nr:hypothetical protein BT93_H2360 [Corymbia citriodora subsp. variegata]KAF8017138.1 hypothetical protein BT93_H2360 [Corymbia citriodora subsp. variegata]
MDRRDAMSASYFTQRGASGAQSLFHGSHGIHPLTNASMPFPSNFGGGSLGSPLAAETSTMPTHEVSAGAPAVVAPPPGEPVKRKRGRPRKYGPEGTVSLALSSTAVSPPGQSSTPRRGRGRPPGSGRKQQLASAGELLSGSAGMGFTPHIINVAVGEDVAAKITSFSQQGSKAVCVLSANGAVNTVTLRQPSSSGGTITYEGRLEILCLSGSFLLTEDGGSRNRMGGLSISLASPDGRVIGGGVGGMLIAASPVQVIVGSFSWGSSRTKHRKGEGSKARAMQTASTAPPTQNLTPVSMGVWPDSQSLDIHDHVDIDLMRG